MMLRKALWTIPAALALAWLALGQMGGLPEGPGRELVLARCQTCHDISLVTRERLSRERWDAVLDEMTLQGLRLTPEERGVILNYLATYLGTEPPPAPPAEAQTPQTTAKTGAEVYAANCQACHGPQGEGNPPTFPPLRVQLPDLLKTEGGRTYLAKVLLFGLQGPIRVAGAEYTRVMPSFAWLSNEDLTLVLNHLLSWSGGGTPFTPEEVARLRNLNLNPEEVHRLRQGFNLP